MGYFYYKVEPAASFNLHLTKHPETPDTIVLDLPEHVTQNVQRGDRIDLHWYEQGKAYDVEGDVYHKRLGRLHVSGWATVVSDR